MYTTCLSGHHLYRLSRAWFTHDFENYLFTIWASLWENRFPTTYDTNRDVQQQKMARGLKFRIRGEDGLYYPCSETKGAVGARLISVFVFAFAKSRFSHDEAQFIWKSQPFETWTIYTNLRSPFHWRHYIKLALNGQAVSEKNIFNQSMTNGTLNAHLTFVQV